VGYTCWPRGFGFCYGLESCIIDLDLPLCPHAIWVIRGKLYVWFSNSGKGMYVKGHGHVELVTLRLSKLVRGCCGVMYITN
jgi:hypothetical protein